MAIPLADRARRIRLLLLDVDGVLTDGKILLHHDGTESKQFDIRDGTGIVLAQKAGIRVGLLSARQSAATIERAAQLRITLVRQGALDKRATYEEIRRELDLDDAEVAFMGDDLLDLPALRVAGFAAAPANAHPFVRSYVHWVTRTRGGQGAVRELCDAILMAQGKLEPLVKRFLPG